KNIERKKMDCIVNKTAISARTNRIIGGEAPSKYLTTLEKRAHMAIPTMDRILSTHLISAHPLRIDGFESFFEKRRESLLGLIAAAMGKTPTSAVDLSEPTGEPLEDEEEANDEAEVVEGA
ncbi:MAG TPA: hypothetical protein VFA23_08995, partial [Dongiaceae bacterium]|nr:hypothetical protein [Dongiaceae bacterium]